MEQEAAAGVTPTAALCIHADWYTDTQILSGRLTAEAICNKIDIDCCSIQSGEGLTVNMGKCSILTDRERDRQRIKSVLFAYNFAGFVHTESTEYIP